MPDTVWDRLLAEIAVKRSLLDSSSAREMLAEARERGVEFAEVLEEHGVEPARIEGLEAEIRAVGEDTSETRVATPLTAGPPGPRLAPPRRESLGRYRILREVGRGGMGVVYLAEDPELDRRVALKVLRGGPDASSEELERFQREAKAAARLDHPGIVQVHEVGTDEDVHYISMEYVDGRTVRDVLESDEEVAQEEALRITEETARALAYAHAQGVIHRDVKPGNLLLTPDGRVRITDFGLAKLVEADSSLTRTGALMGTPSYMAPEQASGRMEQVGPQSDLYSLGAVLYELLAGRPPYDGQSSVQIIYKVLVQRLGQPIEGVRAWEEAIKRDPALEGQLRPMIRQVLEGRE